MRRIFVTGGTGFVGSHVVERLLEEGMEVVCLVRETSDTAHLDRLGVETHVGSLVHVESLRSALADVDAVVHVAGVIKAREADWFYQINADATGDLVRLAAAVNPGLGRFIYVSSVSAQGPSRGRTPRPVAHPAAPVSHYGRSKLAGEVEVLAVAEEVPVTIFRPPPVYGPRDREMLAAFKMAKRGVAGVFGAGDGLLSLVYIDDLVDAIWRALVMPHASGSVYPIDDGGVYTWRDLMAGLGAALGTEPRTLSIPAPIFRAAAHLSQAWGKVVGRAMIFGPDKVAEMEQKSWVCGSGALREELGWRPRWPLERGARHTAQWYREQGWL